MAVYDINGNVICDGSDIFISVKDMGAVGDGATNDSSAIQSALDSASSSGGVIYFPSGTYLLGSALLFYSNQTLYFENGASLKQGAVIDNLLRTYSIDTYTAYNGVHDCTIYGATFDGGNYSTNNTLVGLSHAKNIVFENCVFKNAFGAWHNLEINSSYNVKVINCDFEGSRKTGDYGELIQIDSASSSAVYPWSGVQYDGTVCKYIEISNCIFHSDTISPAIGNHSNAYHKFIRIHDNVFDGLTSSRGTIVFMSNISNVDIYDNTFNGCTTGIASEGATYYIYDNRFVDVTTAISGTTSVAHSNMINGTYTA